MVRATNRSVCMIDNAATGNVTISSQCASGDPTLQWLMDANSGIHFTEKPDQFLTPGNGGHLALSDCSPEQTAQRWTHDNASLKNLGNGKCIDHGRGTVIMYGCHMNANQQWVAPAKTDHLLLTLLDGRAMRKLMTLLN